MYPSIVLLSLYYSLYKTLQLHREGQCTCNTRTASSLGICKLINATDVCNDFSEAMEYCALMINSQRDDGQMLQAI